MTHTCYLCLGSNMPPKLRRLDQALNALGDICTVMSTSESIESDDDSGLGQRYLNLVAMCTTTMNLDDMRVAIRDIEASQGRRPDSKERGSMPIDIDIVVFDDIVVSPYDFSRPYFTICYRQLSTNGTSL